jgi:hypothetical protein
MVGGALAVRLDDMVGLAPDDHPAMPYDDTTPAASYPPTQFFSELGIYSLLTVVAHEDHSYVCTSIDDAGNAVFGRAKYFVYALRNYPADGPPMWTTSLAP